MRFLYFLVIFILSIGMGYWLASCGSVEPEAEASAPADIECKILNAWDFKRCENSEVVCYANDNGISCKWK